tara:strand:- start:5555 stop:6658 length:1104 start_codon:yes stop_codon:yes gene_type:complete
MSKLLSQGGYGCVYYPGISCDGYPMTNEKKVVTKIQSDQEWTRREIAVGNKIVNIENFLWYFSPVIESCPIQLTKIDSNLLKNCEVIKKGDINYIVMMVPYINSSSFLKTLFKEYNHNILLQLFEINKHIFTAIKLLIDNNVVHLDIKAENILFDSVKKTPVLIDFGIAIDITTLNKNTFPDIHKNFFYGYHPDYPLWCLEIQFINYILNKKTDYNETLNYDDIQKVCEECILQHARFVKVFSRNFIDNYCIAAIKYYQQYIGKTYQTFIHEIIELSWKTWDIYSFALVNLHIYSFLFEKGFFKNDLLTSVFESVIISLHYDPTKRYDINTKIYNINSNKFFKNNSMEESLHLIHNINIISENIDYK